MFGLTLTKRLLQAAVAFFDTESRGHEDPLVETVSSWEVFAFHEIKKT